MKFPTIDTPVDIGQFTKELSDVGSANFMVRQWLKSMRESFDSIYKYWEDYTWIFLDVYKRNPKMKYFDSSQLALSSTDSMSIADKVSKEKERVEKLQADINMYIRQLNRVSSYTNPSSINDLEDTETYTTATTFLGVWGTDTSLSYFKPRTITKLIDLTDTMNYYPVSEEVLYMNSSSDIISTSYSKRLRVETLAATGLETTATISGSDLNRVYWSLDIDDNASCTSFIITLEPADYNGAVSYFKVTSGDATDIYKRIVAGGGASLMNGGVSYFPLNNKYCLKLVYDQLNNTFWKTEGHIP